MNNKEVMKETKKWIRDNKKAQKISRIIMNNSNLYCSIYEFLLKLYQGNKIGHRG